MAIRPGSVVVFSNKKNAAFSVLQKLITHEWIDGVSPRKFKHGDKTHSAIFWYPEANADAIFEAYLCTTIDPWIKHQADTRYWVFEPTGYTDEEIQSALFELYNKDAGEGYGFFELPWYVYRFVMEWFHKDVRHQHNWFPGGNICSQDVFNFLYILSRNRPALRAYLDQWRSTTFHSSDTYTVMLNPVTQFTLKYIQQ